MLLWPSLMFGGFMRLISARSRSVECCGVLWYDFLCGLHLTSVSFSAGFHAVWIVMDYNA